MNRLIQWYVRLKPEIVVFVLTAALIGTVLVFANHTINRMDKSNSAAVAAATGHTADLIAERFGETARRIEQLQRLAALATDAYLGHRPTEAAVLANEIRQATAQEGSLIPNVIAMDRDGNQIWSTQTMPLMPPQANNFAFRDYFDQIVKYGHETFVGRPIRGIVSREYVIPFASAARDAAGKLQGIVVAGVNAQQLHPLAAGLALGADDLLSLFREDGIALARSQDVGIGEPVRVSGLFDKIKAHGQVDDIIIGTVSGVPKILSARRVPGTGLFIIVSRMAADALAPGQSAVAEVKRWAALISLALGGSGILLVVLSNRARRLREIEQRSLALAQSETILHELSGGAPVMMGLLDAERRWIFVNDAIKSLMGRSPEGLIGKLAGTTLPAADHALIHTTLDTLERTGETANLEVSTPAPNGAIVWLNVIVSTSMVDLPGGGTVRRFVVIILDVTRRKLAEDALREAHEEIASLLKITSGLIYKTTFSPDAVWHVVLQPGSTFLGYDAATIATPGFTKTRASPEDCSRREAAYRKCRQDGSAVVELEITAANGEKRWVRDAMNLGSGAGGKPAVIGFVTDITDEYRTKQSLARTERLAFLGTMASGIAHEMNQPLAAISMAAQNGILLLREPEAPAEPAIRKFERIVEQTNRISEVITHIRVVGGSGSGEPVPFAMTDAMQGVMLLIEQNLKTAGVTAQWKIAPGLPMIRAPRVLIEHMLINLIVNACDAYTSKAEALGRQAPRIIAIDARRDGDWAHIRVADNAGGIPDALIQRIFDPFVSTKPGKGMGLGLSIGYATVSDTGGCMNVHNENGGAVFDVHLPLAGVRGAA